jgi:hypothetical protein
VLLAPFPADGLAGGDRDALLVGAADPAFAGNHVEELAGRGLVPPDQPAGREVEAGGPRSALRAGQQRLREAAAVQEDPPPDGLVEAQRHVLVVLDEPGVGEVLRRSTGEVGDHRRERHAALLGSTLDPRGHVRRKGDGPANAGHASSMNQQ